MDRGRLPKGIAANPEWVESIRSALVYAASPEGAGLTRKNIYYALMDSGTFSVGYGRFSDYCRESERDLWDSVASR